MKTLSRASLILSLMLMLFEVSTMALGQEKRGDETLVSGTIVDDTGDALPGVTIRIKEGDRGGLSDADGSFSIWLKPGERTLIFSYVGMKTQEVIVGKSAVLRIVMEDDTKILREVVVTGYQTISKERATGSFAVITPETLGKKLQISIVDRLEGQVAGLTKDRDGNLSIRGISTLRGNQAPLIVLDGMPCEGSLKSINPSIITNITVLKDAAAASIYGARAANGVIVISTLQGEGNNKTRVSYDGSLHVLPTQNYSKLNLMNSRELVELQRYAIKLDKTDYNALMQNDRYAINPVYEALLKNRAGLISADEMNKTLDYYSGLDNRSQLKDYFLRTGIQHQHNLSVSGGSAKNTYAASVNYTGNELNSKYSHSDMFGLTLRDNVRFFNWLGADLGFSTTTTRSWSESGAGSYLGWLKGYPSYYMIQDENGNPMNIRYSKSEAEMKRLIDLGLNDEHYSPIINRSKESSSNVYNYYRVNFGLNFKIAEGLTFDAKYLGEFSSYRVTETYDKDSYKVKRMINDAAQIDKDSGEITYNVPQGGQYSETRGDNNSYTLRGQFNYRLEKGKHYFTTLAGAEQRRVKNTSTKTYYMGYDKNSLGYIPVDPIGLSSLLGTEATGGTFNWEYSEHNGLVEAEDRFVSFYANASYSFDQRYDVTGSIRIDQSNLFGTDPRYQYRPLWSIGGTWHMAEEAFMQDSKGWLNALNFRLTYGIGGNVPKNAGPFLTLEAKEHNPLLGAFAASIKNPPNPTLRWEKTATTNFGFDFSLFRNKLWGSIDFYNKHTSDLLALRQADPTLGWEDLLLNYGSMRNSGCDITLNAHVGSGNFEWTPSFNIGINHNKLLNVEENNPNTFNYTNGGAAAVGYPLGAVFSFKYAGLDKEGKPMYYNKSGEKVRDIENLEDLEYSGPSIPVYSGSLTNSFRYKDFDLSFMFIFNGGHVFRAEAATYSSLPSSSNTNRETLNSWRTPGDELDPNKSPAFTGEKVPTERQHQWYTSNKHILRGDYIKLRDLSLGYTLPTTLASRIGVRSIRLVLQVQDLFTITRNKRGFDPESTTTYMYGWGQRSVPIQTSFTLGASVNF